jgi:Rieske Fe-S protein
MKYKKNNKIFLKQLFSALAVICCGYFLWILFNYFFFSPISNATGIGKYSQFQIDQIIHKENERVFIVRDTIGLYAVSDVCTHRACMLRIKNGRFECPCHEGVFTRDGRPAGGPVNKSLDHYYIYKNKQNQLVVDVSRVVQKEFRYSE